jgi:hydrogenase nickel incorporation protein HypA/HybF
MHELSIAMNIVQITGEKLASYPGKKPVKITLQIGLLAGVEFDALDFALQSATRGTLLENALIEIEKIKGEAQCSVCQVKFPAEDYLVNCPECGSFQINFLSGRELLIRSIEME